MFCANCGIEVGQGQRFCGSCGHPVSSIPTASPTEAKIAPSEGSAQPASPLRKELPPRRASSSGGIRAVVIAAVVFGVLGLAVVLVGAAFFVFRGAKKTPTLDHMNATYYEPGRGLYVKLTKGQYRGGPEGDNWLLGVTAPPAWGDLNSDGNQEAVMLVGLSQGASGSVTMVEVLDPSTSKAVAWEVLGDGIVVKDLTVSDGVIRLSTVEHGPDDPHCCPTVKLVRQLRLKDGVLVEAAPVLPPDIRPYSDANVMKYAFLMTQNHHGDVLIRFYVKNTGPKPIDYAVVHIKLLKLVFEPPPTIKLVPMGEVEEAVRVVPPVRPGTTGEVDYYLSRKPWDAEAGESLGSRWNLKTPELRFYTLGRSSK
jgi:hypothetical protein